MKFEKWVPPNKKCMVYTNRTSGTEGVITYPTPNTPVWEWEAGFVGGSSFDRGFSSDESSAYWGMVSAIRTELDRLRNAYTAALDGE